VGRTRAQKTHCQDDWAVLYWSRQGALPGADAALAPIKLLFKFQYALTPPASSNTDYAAVRWWEDSGFALAAPHNPYFVVGRTREEQRK
jgi:hypothetical protein